MHLLLHAQGVQADNEQPDAQHPVMLVLPRPPMQWPAFKRALSSVAASASSKSRRAASTARLAVWRRRPGGEIVTSDHEHGTSAPAQKCKFPDMLYAICGSCRMTCCCKFLNNNLLQTYVRWWRCHGQLTVLAGRRALCGGAGPGSGTLGAGRGAGARSLPGGLRSCRSSAFPRLSPRCSTPCSTLCWAQLVSGHCQNPAGTIFDTLTAPSTIAAS